MNLVKYLFLDRDGTLIEEPLDSQIDSIEKFRLMPSVIPSLVRLKQNGYRFVMVSNQDGLGSEKYPLEQYETIQTLLISILESQGIRFEAVRICGHFDSDRCFCRKPQVGLVKDYLSLSELDRNRSFVIGDRQSDIVLAENMGITGLCINKDYGWPQITQELLSKPRRGLSYRKTRETEVRAEVNLDETHTIDISTGIGLLDHFIEQLSYHGGFSTKLKVKGDLHVDDHHTIEDTAIALGTALRQALGDKVGIERFGFYLPMDDASVRVALDLSGRNYLKFEGSFSRETLGEFSTEMVPHFFRSFADGIGATLHIQVSGENCHHKIESIFKAVGRSLRSAIHIPISQEGFQGIPSTKGVL